MPEAVPGEDATPHIARARASSPAAAPAAASPWEETPALPSDQPSPPGPRERATLWAGRADRATAGPHFADRHRMTIREHWEHHATHAGRYPPVFAWSRYAWGAVAVLLDVIWEDLVREWLLRHPSRAAGLAVLIFVLWLCLGR